MHYYGYIISAGLIAISTWYLTQKLQVFIIYPSNFPAGSRDTVLAPSKYGIPYDETWLETKDNVKLHVYVMDQASPKTILMLGPNAGNMGMSVPLAAIFYQDMGYNVVTLSYRGYGKSTGTPSEIGLKIDADTALNFIQNHTTLKDTSLILYGRSLGGAVAIYLAQNSFVKGVVLENTFLSIPRLVPFVLPAVRFLTPLITEKWQSLETITKISPSIPFLFLSGKRDELIPPAHFYQLFELCPSKTKLWQSFDHGYHNDTYIQDGYWPILADFIADCIEPFTPKNKWD